MAVTEKQKRNLLACLSVTAGLVPFLGQLFLLFSLYRRKEMRFWWLAVVPLAYFTFFLIWSVQVNDRKKKMEEEIFDRLFAIEFRGDEPASSPEIMQRLADKFSSFSTTPGTGFTPMKNLEEFYSVYTKSYSQQSGSTPFHIPDTEENRKKLAGEVSDTVDSYHAEPFSYYLGGLVFVFFWFMSFVISFATPLPPRSLPTPTRAPEGPVPAPRRRTTTVRINTAFPDEIRRELQLSDLQARFILFNRDSRGPYRDLADFSERTRLPAAELERVASRLDFSAHAGENSEQITAATLPETLLINSAHADEIRRVTGITTLQARTVILERDRGRIFPGLADFKSRSGLPGLICDRIAKHLDFTHEANEDTSIGRVIEF